MPARPGQAQTACGRRDWFGGGITITRIETIEFGGYPLPTPGNIEIGLNSSSMGFIDCCLFAGYVAFVLLFPPENLAWWTVAQTVLLSWLVAIISVRALRASRGNVKRTLVELGSGDALHRRRFPARKQVAC